MRFTFLWLVLAVCSGSAFGGDLTYRPVSGGLQMSLTTNGYKFEVGGQLSPVKAKNGRRIAANKPPNLVASVVLANRGSAGVPFTFADAAAAERKFRFKVFTEDGTQIWESEPAVADGFTEVEANLEKRSPWRRTVQVPLSVGATWLAAGRYTLEAFVDAKGGPGATAVFEVVNSTVPSIPPAPGTGIEGKVLAPTMWLTTGIEGGGAYPTRFEPIRAYVTVQEIVPPNGQTIRAPFTWAGFTDAEGNFRAPTIAGRFKVTANPDHVQRPTAEAIIPPVDGWPNPAATVEIEVPRGQFVNVVLKVRAEPIIFSWPKVYSVDEVNVAYLPTLTTPGMLRITANGTVTSGGWSNARLVQRPESRGIVVGGMVLPGFRTDLLEFDLVATPPSGPATAVMSPIVASKDISLPAGIREIRVHSQTNSQSVVLP